MDEKKTKKEIKNIFSKAKETGIKLDDFLLFILNYLLYLYLVVYHNEEFDSLKKNGKNDIGIIPELTFIINDDWTKIDLSVIKKKGEEQGKAIDSLFVNYFTIFMKIVYSNLDKLKVFSGPLDLENKLKVLREQDLEKQYVYVNVFKKLPQEEFKHKADVAKCFDLVIDVFVNSFNKLGPVYYSSSNYREVLKKFGYYEDVKSVYDNCVGLGNLFDLTKDIACYGQDINPELVKICRIKLFINEKDHKNNENKNYENIKTWDTLLSDGLKEPPVDLAFSECPWGRGINKVNKDDERFCIFRDIFPEDKPMEFKAEHIFMVDALSHIKDTGGKAVVTAPQSFLYREDRDKDFRKVLIDNNYIEGIINIPSVALSDYTTNSLILILRKDKKDHSIKLLDLTDYYDLKERGKVKQIKSIKLEEAFKVYNGDVEGERDNFKVIYIGDIKKHNYNLSFSNYFKTNAMGESKANKEYRKKIEKWREESERNKQDLNRYIRGFEEQLYKGK